MHRRIIVYTDNILASMLVSVLKSNLVPFPVLFLPRKFSLFIFLGFMFILFILCTFLFVFTKHEVEVTKYSTLVIFSAITVLC